MNAEALVADGPSLLLGMLVGAILSALVALGIGLVLRARQAASLDRLRAELAAEQRVAAERERVFGEARQQLEASFSALSDRALDRTNRQFLRLAEARLKVARAEASADLDARRRAVEGLVKPIQEALIRTERQLKGFEEERRQAHGALERHLELMTSDHRALRGETQKLVQALRRPEVRGRWGELTLRRLVELAGMVEHCDFSEQVHRNDGERSVRPDLLIHLPDERDVVVDVKAPLDAYLTAQEATTEEERERALEGHARNVRNRVRELAAKAYWEQFEAAPDFVVLFVPGEQFLAAALDRDPSLLEDALRERVILASPTSFVAILRAVAYSWRQLQMVRNAQEIRELAERFYKRVATFSGHYAKLSRALAATVDQFNRSVGSLQRQVLPAAMKLSELGVDTGKTLDLPDTVDTPVRDV